MSSYAGIEHKLKVFISSRCGGEYSVTRKALKKILQETGLVDVYAFETETASSEDVHSSYLNYVNESNLCIFLIDNKDGASLAVLDEEKRAKEQQLRLLYIFCDERSKTPTAMQEEVMNSGTQRYATVHEFSDFVEKAYDSVLQDIIAIYKKKEGTNIPISTSESTMNNSVLSVAGMDAKLSNQYKHFSNVCNVILQKLGRSSIQKQDQETSLLEQLLAEQLKVVLNEKRRNTSFLDELLKEIGKDISGEIKALLKIRFEAKKSFYRNHYPTCLTQLKKALKISVESPMIPAWISNDIAVDIRHIVSVIDDRKNQITMHNQGQKYLDESSEPLYYPYLDRLVKNAIEEMNDRLYVELTKSPYASYYYGVETIINPLVDSFCIAELNGSIIQSEITRNRLAKVYAMLTIIYEDHSLFIEYIRLLLICRDVKKIDNVIRTYNQSVEIINNQDVKMILESINTITDPLEQMMSKYLMGSRLGGFLDDDSFETVSSELIEYANKWIEAENRYVQMQPYVFDFYSNNVTRIASKDIIFFIENVFAHQRARLYSDCYKILARIDFSKVEKQEQNRIKAIFMNINSKNRLDLSGDYERAVIRFCKIASVSYNDLLNRIMKIAPSLYRTLVQELDIQQGRNIAMHIRQYLIEEKERNQMQESSDHFTQYSYEGFDVIRNILLFKNYKLSPSLEKKIIEEIITTLSLEHQTVVSKIAALKLLHYIYFKDPNNDIWTHISEIMIDKADVFSFGYEFGFGLKDTNVILAFQYDLFLSHFYKHKINNVIYKFLTIDKNDSYVIIQTLKTIVEYLQNFRKNNLDANLIMTILSLCISLSKYKERDIRYYSAYVLIELTHFSESQTLALKHLLTIMDTGAQAEKIAIVSHIKEIKSKDKKYLDQIINKGKVDNNYLVRYILKTT